MRTIWRRALAVAMTGAMAWAPSGGALAADEAEILTGGDRKDIVFIILDDVGVDQLSLFGYGGLMPPKMPNLRTIAQAGVRFTNTWAMPQCSPSRATFFTGRYPSRTGVVNAIVDNHIPQAYLSSFEATLPRLLSDAGYTSSMVGKYHLGDENDPAGTCAPSTRGFDRFIGNLTPGPPSIDPTAGGIDQKGNQTCGFFQTTATGACYTLVQGKMSCSYLRQGDALPKTTPAETCLQTGGIFTPAEACGSTTPTRKAFTVDNGYYVWPKVSLTGATSPYAAPECTKQRTTRDYMTTAQAEDAASWWNSQRGRKMLSLSFNSMHTPLQPAPNQLVRGGPQDPYDCAATLASRPLINGMLESADVEIGRFLADIGKATLSKDGKSIKKLDLAGTTVVIVGDNGSFGGTVRAESGFSTGRSKGYVYQTGVWVPLIVAGDIVVEPGRKVDDLVNVADLFHLFGALAGVDVAKAVPPQTILDAKPLLPYLRHPDRPAIRKTNYAELGAGEFLPEKSERSWPCMIVSTCNDVLFPTQSLCETNAGTWYGPGGAKQASSCCSVIDADAGQTIFPVAQYAVRDKTYKLVRMDNTDCSSPLKRGQSKPFPWAQYNTKTTYEFYSLEKTKTNPAGMDKANANFAADCGTDPESCLPKRYLGRYQALYDDLEGILASAKPQNACAAIGDGNMDMRVDDRDIAGWKSFTGKGPSRYDINTDGITNRRDLAIIKRNLGTNCSKKDFQEKAAALVE